MQQEKDQRHFAHDSGAFQINGFYGIGVMNMQNSSVSDTETHESMRCISGDTVHVSKKTG